MTRLLALLLVATSALAAPKAPDLSKLKTFPETGRVQDTEFHQDPIIAAVIAMGPDAVPFLIGKLADTKKLPKGFISTWPDVRVGDAAFVILTDVFLDSTWDRPCVPGVSWMELVGADPTKGPYESYQAFLKASKGRAGLQARLRKLLKGKTLKWDESQRCFQAP